MEIKQAAAQANRQTGILVSELADAITRAAKEVIAGQWQEEFTLDVFQAGAGTSYNMNVNEIIANRALEVLGQARGDYTRLYPNNHVNQSQSTNDTMPTAIGTGVNTYPDYARLVVVQLSKITALPLRAALDRIQAQQSLSDFLALSSVLRGFLAGKG